MKEPAAVSREGKRARMGVRREKNIVINQHAARVVKKPKERCNAKVYWETQFVVGGGKKKK